MVHSTGEVGGCWGHDAKANVRDTPVAEILEAGTATARSTRGSSARSASGCGSNYALNLAWRPRTYVDDVLWRAGQAPARWPPVRSA